MLKNLISNIQNKYNNMKQENEYLDELLNKTTTFNNLYPIPPLKNTYPEQKITFILNNCPDINEEKAKTITNIIPIQETYLEVFYATETLTNKEYFLIPTNKYLWLISNTHYGAFPYQNLNATIIKNNIMSKIILITNVLLEVNGNNQKIDNLINIINSSTIRNNLIQEKVSYLQGITPIYQKINKLNSGISIDNNNIIVFHNKTLSLKCTPKDITNYEILLDNQLYFSKNSSTSKSMTSFNTSCSQINIRITTPNQTFIIPILEPNTFGTKYTTHDTTFTKNLNFAKEITSKLQELTKPDYEK